MANANKHKSMSYTRFGYIFVAPFVIAYCVFSLYPLLSTFWYSTARMQSTTADFWGFGNKEVYYDRYLDLKSDAIGLDFDEAGIDKIKYGGIRDFFTIQNAVDMYNPLDEDGINAVIATANDGKIDSAVAQELQQAYTDKDIGKLTPDSLTALTNWKNDYSASNYYMILTSKLKAFKTTLDTIVDTEDTTSTTDDTETAVTAATIIGTEGDSTDFDDFRTTLNGLTDFTPEQLALIDYLVAHVNTELGTDYTTLAQYFTDVKDGKQAIEDPTFYYVCKNLNAPTVTYTTTDDSGNDTEATIDAISVPFMSDLEDYLTTNVWKNTISSTSSYANLVGYIDGSINLTDNMDQLYADIKALNDAGIIDAEALVLDNGTVVAAKTNDNFLYTFDAQYVSAETPYESNDTYNDAAIYIGTLQNFNQVAATAIDNIVQYNKIDDPTKYITYSGDFNISLYKEFKTALGLSDVLTIDKYNELESTRKAENVAKAKKDLADAQKQLPAVEKAYNEAIGTDNEDSAYNDMRKVELKVISAQNEIKCPKGLLYRVDATTSYVSVGMGNFNTIFKDTDRFNTIAGAFTSTAILWIIGFIPQILLALILSAWFTDTKLHLKGLNLMKALMYLPNVITAATIAIFFRKIFSYSTGATMTASQQFLHLMGDKDGYNFFASAWSTRFLVCFINFWMWYGNTMIILIAAITSINDSIYESAQLDGASSFQTYTQITLPLLRPMLLYTLVTSLIGGLQMYDIPQNLNMHPAVIYFGTTTIASIETVLMYVNQQAFGMGSNKQVGIASAVSVLLFLVTTILSILIFYIMRDRDAAKARKLMKKGGTK